MKLTHDINPHENALSLSWIESETLNQFKEALSEKMRFCSLSILPEDLQLLIWDFAAYVADEAYERGRNN